MKARILPLIAAIASLMSITGLNVSYAQNSFSTKHSVIKGKLVDIATGEPEIGAVVQFFKSDNPEKPVAYTLTDTEGQFEHYIDASGDL